MGEPDLREATTLSRNVSEPTCFDGEISSDWTIVHVFGGVAMYVALRAMRELLDEDASSVAAAFLA